MRSMVCVSACRVIRACVRVSYSRAYLAYRYRVSSASLSRVQRVPSASLPRRLSLALTRLSLAYRWCDCGVTVVWASAELRGAA